MRVLFSGGGTGGHIYPALALARHILKREKEARLLFVGTAGGLESKIIPAEGFRLVTITARGYRRRIGQLGTVTADLLRGSMQARRLIHEFAPDVVVGTGGYVAAPAIIAALLSRVPAVIHEQNAIPGMANRYLAPFVSMVCLSFEYSRRYFKRRSRTVLTGNPRASEVAAITRDEGCRHLKLDPGKRVILIYGGSRGAWKLNRVVTELLNWRWLPKSVQLIFVTGENYYQEVLSKAGPLQEGVSIYPYLADMPLALAAADLVIARSGATTMAELTALGLPAILVPSPNVVNNHQYYNARLLSDAGAAVLVEEKDFNPYRLRRELESLLGEPELLSGLARNSRSLGICDAAEQVYRCLQAAAKNGQPALTH